MRPALEVAVTSVAGARIACAAGADRIELCSALELGGVTPSAGLVEAAVAEAPAGGAHVLVRPRPGDFVYDADDVAVALPTTCGRRSRMAPGASSSAR